MVCRECGNRMDADDIGRSRNRLDIYWKCDKCNSSCIEVVKDNISMAEFWHVENDKEIKDYTISNHFA